MEGQHPSKQGKVQWTSKAKHTSTLNKQDKVVAVVHLVLLKVTRNLSPIGSTHKGEIRCKWNTQGQDGANMTKHNSQR